MIASIILIIIMSVIIVGRQTSTSTPSNEDKTQTKESETTASEDSADEPESAEKSESSADIKIVNSSFKPATYKIKKDDRIIWQNQDTTVHTITSDTGTFDSGNLDQGKTFTQKFEFKKTIPYHCKIHPNMKAEITVE